MKLETDDCSFSSPKPELQVIQPVRGKSPDAGFDYIKGPKYTQDIHMQPRRPANWREIDLSLGKTANAHCCSQ